MMLPSKAVVASTWLPLVLVTIPFLLVSECQGQGDFDPGLFSELSSSSLAENPFFISMIAQNFRGEGTEGLDPKEVGSFCRFLGPLKCEDKFELQCRGVGAIDCTGECPGEEHVLDELLDQMGNKTFMEDLPLLSELLEQKKKASNGSGKGVEVFKDIISGCNFEAYDALFSIVSEGKPLDFGGGDSGDPITQVDEDAIEGFGGYDYDYDYEEEETGGDIATTKEVSDASFASVRLHGLENQDEGEVSTTGSAAATTTTASTAASTGGSPKTTIVPGHSIVKVEEMRKRREVQELEKRFQQLESEVTAFKGMIRAALERLETTKENGRAKDKEEEEEIDWLIGNLSSFGRRVIRSVVEDDVSTSPTLATPEEPAKCRVFNMSCVVFPKIGQCTGITAGACLTTGEALSLIVSARLVVIVVAVVVCLAVMGVGVSYYFFKRNRTVIPVESANGNNASAANGRPPKQTTVMVATAPNDKVN